MKLKKCPFCGRRPEFIERQDFENWVSGIKCKCGFNAYFYNKNGVNISPMYKDIKSQKEIIAKYWNRRAK